MPEIHELLPGDVVWVVGDTLHKPPKFYLDDAELIVQKADRVAVWNGSHVEFHPLHRCFGDREEAVGYILAVCRETGRGHVMP